MMKKLMGLTSLTLLFLTTACSKTYTCACTDDTDKVVYTEDFRCQSKSEAQEDCRSKGFECDIL